MNRKELQQKLSEKKFDKEIDTLNNFYFENQYIKSLLDVVRNGEESNNDRTGTGTIRLTTGYRFVFSNCVIPLLRGKLVNPWNALTEVIWILLGRNDLAWLKTNGVNYWDQWVKPDGTFGNIYGPMMRNQSGFDQLVYVINKLNSSKESRQALINLWHGADLENQALPPCHFLYHPLIVNDKLHLHCGQRSSDSFLGVPYDYMLFYFMQQILAYWTDTKPGKIIHTNNDYHIYQNHYSAIYKYMENYLANPEQKFTNPNFHSIEIKLQFPDKSLYLNHTGEITSSGMTLWLEEFYKLNKQFESNYNDKKLRYGLIKANVSV